MAQLCICIYTVYPVVCQGCKGDCSKEFLNHFVPTKTDYRYLFRMPHHQVIFRQYSTCFGTMKCVEIPIPGYISIGIIFVFTPSDRGPHHFKPEYLIPPGISLPDTRAFAVLIAIFVNNTIVFVTRRGNKGLTITSQGTKTNHRYQVRRNDSKCVTALLQLVE